MSAPTETASPACPDCVITGALPPPEPSRKPQLSTGERWLLQELGNTAHALRAGRGFCEFVQENVHEISRECMEHVNGLAAKNVCWVARECKDLLFLKFTGKGAQAMFEICRPEEAASVKNAAVLARRLAKTVRPVPTPEPRRLRL